MDSSLTGEMGRTEIIPGDRYFHRDGSSPRPGMAAGPQAYLQGCALQYQGSRPVCSKEPRKAEPRAQFTLMQPAYHGTVNSRTRRCGSREDSPLSGDEPSRKNWKAGYRRGCGTQKKVLILRDWNSSDNLRCGRPVAEKGSPAKDRFVSR